MPRSRRADLVQLEQIAAGYPSRERFLTELTLDPPDATSDEAGAAAARRGLPDPLHHPFRQGAGVEIGLRAQRRRRLHPLRPRHRLVGGDRGGAAAALRRHDARQGPAPPHRAAALLHALSRRAAATATSMPRARASFRRRCSASSKSSAGPRSPTPAHGRPGRSRQPGSRQAAHARHVALKKICAPGSPAGCSHQRNLIFESRFQVAVDSL